MSHIKGLFAFVKDGEITIKESPADNWFMRSEYGMYHLVARNKLMTASPITVVPPVEPPQGHIVAADLMMGGEKMGYIEYLEEPPPPIDPPPIEEIAPLPAPVDPQPQ